MTDRALHAGLDRLGIPWRESKGALKSRNGITHWPGPADAAVQLDTKRPIPGLIMPLSFRDAGWSPAMPPSYIHGYFWWHDDAEANLARTRAFLEPLLGEPADGRGLSTNIKAWAWHDGPASITATCWPARLNRHPMRNDNHDADARTRLACHVAIRSGFRPECSTEELAWLRDCAVIATVQPPFANPREQRPEPRKGLLSRLFGRPAGSPGAGAPQSAQDALNATPPDDYLLEFERAAPAAAETMYGKIGIAPGGEALISGVGSLRIVPAEQIAAIEIVTVTPGRSWPSGGIEVDALCRLPYAANRLNALRLAGCGAVEAQAVADRLGIPLQHREVDGD